jgi:hypothetical protein
VDEDDHHCAVRLPESPESSESFAQSLALSSASDRIEHILDGGWMMRHSARESADMLADQIDFKALSDAERLRYLDVFDELVTDLNERTLQLQASIAVAEWRAQVHDVLGGVSA